MRIIATCNLFYCAFTFALMVLLFEKPTLLGMIYFSLEIIIVALLAVLEWETASLQ
jgi:hypothetical protein